MTTTITPPAPGARGLLEWPCPAMIIECWPDSDLGGFLDLVQDEQLQLLDWIYENLCVARTWNMTRSSYALKHLYEEQTGRYLTNAQFKDAMILSEYQPKDRHELNHHYRIHPSSPEFSR